MISNNICFIDFETTGIDVFRDEPIEFGAVLVNENLEVLNKFCSKIKINKSVYLKKSAFNIHNIELSDLSNAPNQKEVLMGFYDSFGTDYRLAGWNISFDVTIFRRMCNKNAKMIDYNKINHRHIDVQSLNFLANQLSLFPKQLNSLSDVSNFYSLTRSKNHSALEDALLTLEVYKKLFFLFKSSFE